MCGRYSLHSSAEEVAEAFALDEPPQLFGPRYNIAPSMEVLVVATRRTDDRRIARSLRWGICAPWQRRPASRRLLSQARVETVAEKPAFMAAFHERRCLLVANGFYEWKTTGAAKEPYHVRLCGGGLFGIAALWERNEGEDGNCVVGCVLMTQQADAELLAIHHRMPVVLPAAAYAAWLAPGPVRGEELTALLQSHALGGAAFESNRASFDGPAVAEAIDSCAGP